MCYAYFVEIKKEVETWQREDHNFAETTASCSLLATISQPNTSVTVTGPRGCGKSFLTKHIALKMREKHGYTIIPINGVKEIVERYNSKRKQLFVLDFDNAFKKRQNQLAAFQTRVNDDYKVITCCSKDVFDNPDFKEISVLHQNKFELQADDNILSDKDFEDIATKYMKKCDVVALSDMKEKLKKLDNFPMLCRKFVDEKQTNPTQYFAKYMSIISNDTRSNNSNTEVGINPQQVAQNMFINPSFNNSPVTVNITLNTINKN